MIDTQEDDRLTLPARGEPNENALDNPSSSTLKGIGADFEEWRKIHGLDDGSIDGDKPE